MTYDKKKKKSAKADKTRGKANTNFTRMHSPSPSIEVEDLPPEQDPFQVQPSLLTNTRRMRWKWTTSQKRKRSKSQQGGSGTVRAWSTVLTLIWASAVPNDIHRWRRIWTRGVSLPDLPMGSRPAGTFWPSFLLLTFDKRLLCSWIHQWVSDSHQNLADHKGIILRLL